MAKVIGFVLFLATGAPVFAGLTESGAIQKSLENAELKARLEAQISEAQGRVAASGLWENPTLEYSREELDLQDGTSEETTLWLRQRVNIAGIKGLEKQAALSALQAQKFKVEIAEREWIRLVREGFYQTLAASEVKESFKLQQNRLQAIGTMIQRRVEKGDASKFEALRVSKEIAVTAGELNTADAELLEKSTHFFAMLNTVVEPLSGVLLPPTEPMPAFGAGNHPSLKALKAEKQNQETRAKAASREHWPELTLSVGRKELAEPGLDVDGNTYAIGVEIPLFDRGQGHSQVARSRARQIQADIALLERQLGARFQSTYIAYVSHLDSAAQLRSVTVEAQSSLSQLAEASYRAGELSVMELLDAYQADMAAIERYIDAALAARLSYIQLQHLRGE